MNNKLKPCPFCKVSMNDGLTTQHKDKCFYQEIFEHIRRVEQQPWGKEPYSKEYLEELWNTRVSDKSDLLDELEDIDCLGDLSKILREHGR